MIDVVTEGGGADRDSWCTPEWLTALLPKVALDPCSNARSTVNASLHISLDPIPADGRNNHHAGFVGRWEQGDGLAEKWTNRSVFVNPPFSDILPWAQKLAASTDITAAAFLVNVDTSTAWWKALAARLPYGLFFHKRLQFSPPPGVKASTNSKPQALLMDRPFLLACKPELLAYGTLWAVCP